MSTDEHGKRFDGGEEIAPGLDLSDIHRTDQKPRRINVDFPGWMVESLDREARRLGVTRQSLIKIWIAEMLERKGVPPHAP